MAGVPSTPALRALRAAGVPHGVHRYRYVEGGGTAAYAASTGIDEHVVVKTIVVDGDAGPHLVLMHGDREVSLRAVARHLGVKAMSPATPAVAERVTGYRVGGISPFGTRRALPVLCAATVLELETVHVNGGTRGVLVSLGPSWFVTLLDATPVDITA